MFVKRQRQVSKAQTGYQNVELTEVTPAQEASFLQQMRASSAPASGSASLSTSMADVSGTRPVFNVGISSFLMSQGMGTISRALLPAIREDSDSVRFSKQISSKVKLDDFEEVRSLGAGAFGKVLLVRHKQTGEQFAMKTMDKAKFKAQKIESKAKSEQFILRTVRHKFIVGLHYAFQGAEFWALVMDFCCNGDLLRALVEHGNPGLRIPDVVRVTGEVLLALEHLHGMKVIFRDLKPDNVVVDENWRARLTDFGFAKKNSQVLPRQRQCVGLMVMLLQKLWQGQGSSTLLA
jgi:serine/threonine protein kinase